MKNSNQNSVKNTSNKFYFLMVLATTIGFAQTEKSSEETVKAKSDMSSASAQTNPYFKDNQMAGEMLRNSEAISSDSKVEGIDDWQTQASKAPADVNTEPVVITKQRTKSNNTNERTTKPNGQDDGNPFPPKSLVKEESSIKSGYNVKANKKI